MLRPQEVRAQLAVSASTLRAWSTEFTDYLSPAARTSAPGHTHRRYTAADVQVLAHISQLLQRGHRGEEVKHLLLPPPGSLDEQSGAPDQTQAAERDRSRLVEALVEREGQLHDLEERLGRVRRLADTLGQQADEYHRHLEAERAAHAETQRTLLQVRRELVAAQRAVAGLHAQVKLLETEAKTPVWRRVFR